MSLSLSLSLSLRDILPFPLPSPHVHFPPTPVLTKTGTTHSKTAYDRKPIVVLPNECELPERDGRGYFDCLHQPTTTMTEGLPPPSPDDSELSELAGLAGVNLKDSPGAGLRTTTTTTTTTTRRRMKRPKRNRSSRCLKREERLGVSFSKEEEEEGCLGGF